MAGLRCFLATACPAGEGLQAVMVLRRLCELQEEKIKLILKRGKFPKVRSGEIVRVTKALFEAGKE